MGNLPYKAENANTSSFPRKRETSVVRGSATTTLGPRVRGDDRGLWNTGLHALISDD